MHHRSLREHSAALDRGDGGVREIDRQEASADGGNGGVLRPHEPAGEAQRQSGPLVQQLRPGLHPQLQDLRHRLRLRPSLPRQLATARESGGEAQVRDPVGELPLRGRRHGAWQARGADGVRAVEHGEGLRPVAARRLLQVGVRHRARVGQEGRRRGRRHGVAARRRGHGGVPRRLRHRAQRHAVDSGDAQGAVVPVGHAQARGAGDQEDPEDGVRLRLIDLVFLLRAGVLCPLGKSTRNGAERSTKGGVLACSVPTSADLAA